MNALPVPATLSIPINKSVSTSEASYDSSSIGEFVAVYSMNQNIQPPVLFVNKNSLEFISDNFDVDDKYATFVNNLKYTASINGYDLPNPDVLENAVMVQSFFECKQVQVQNIVPLNEGGVGFEFYNRGNYYNIKLDNEGDGVFYKEIPNEIPKGWDYNFPNLIKKLKTEF